MKGRALTLLKPFLGDASHLRFQQPASGDERFVLPTRTNSTRFTKRKQSDEKLGNLIAERSSLESTRSFPYAAGPLLCEHSSQSEAAAGGAGVEGEEPTE